MHTSIIQGSRRTRLRRIVPVLAALAAAPVAAQNDLPLHLFAYDRAAPYWHCFLGLERYWRKRAEHASA